MVPGEVISHYEIAGKLGEGGMGVVWKAWDRKLNRFVALKFLAPHLASSPEQVSRFRQEALAISALNHQNIATIYEIDEVDGHCFLALEYLPGGTLKAALEPLKTGGQFLSLEQGLEYAIQIADALAHAHSHGVIHRDVKSGNVLFTASGLLKITDFGLAKLAGGIDITNAGSVLGTPSMMSPEQAQGLDVDERTDIFSLGVLMFELFTLRLPFRGSNPAVVLHEIVYSPAPLLGQIRSDLPAALEQIVATTLEKDPKKRYQSASDLSADLRAVRRGLMGSSLGRTSQITVTMPSAPARRWGRKRRLAIAGVCLGIALMATVWTTSPALRNRIAASIGSSPQISLPSEKRVAILPFRYDGTDQQVRAFADGLKEVLNSKLTSLERVGGSLVMVVSQDEVESAALSSPTDAWRKLGANLVFEGAVVQQGQQNLVEVRLVDPRSRMTLGSKAVDISKMDVGSAAEQLVGLMEREVSREERDVLEFGESSKPAAVRYYIEGRGYLLRFDRQDNLNLAVRAFQDALAIDPGYAVARAGLAEAYWRQYNLQKDPTLLTEAAGDADQALKLNSRLASLHLTSGQIRLTQGDRDAAARELNEALAIQPANARALNTLGDLYYEEHRYDQAEATYRKAIEIRSGDAASQIYLGRFYFRRHRWTDAEASLLRAIDLAPDSYLAHRILGAVYIMQGRYDAAIEHLDKSVSLEPNAAAYTNLGTAYYHLRKYREAALAFQEAVQRADKNSKYWGNLADAYRWTPALVDQAAPAYRRAIELVKEELQLNPTDADLHARLAMYSVSVPSASAEDRRLARTEIATARHLDETSASVQFHAALVFEQLGDRGDALKALEIAVRNGQSIADIEAAPPLTQLRKDSRYVRVVSPIAAGAK